jgi:hypothetical protein
VKWIGRLRAYVDPYRDARRQLERELRASASPSRPFVCPHDNDPLCRKYGCPDDPEWRGDR